MRTLSVLLLVALAAYLVLCLYTYLRQRQLIYFPTPPAISELSPTWFDGAGERIKTWVLRADREAAVVYFGGNGEDVHQARVLFDHHLPGHAVYLVNYRGYGGSSGRPSEAGLYADALAVFDAVAGRHRRVALIGRSLGSAVATHVAAHRSPAALVLVTPMDSVEALARRLYPYLPVSWLITDPHRSVDRVGAITAPTLVVLAEHDRVVPAANSRRLVAAMAVPPREITLAGHDHNSFVDDPGYAAAIDAFLGGQADSPR